MSRISFSPSDTTLSTTLRTLGFPSRVLVWPSNSGFWTLTETTAFSPSRTWSPVKFLSASFRVPFFRHSEFTVRVTDALNPSRWVPPSTVRMLFA